MYPQNRHMYVLSKNKKHITNFHPKNVINTVVKLALYLLQNAFNGNALRQILRYINKLTFFIFFKEWLINKDFCQTYSFYNECPPFISDIIEENVDTAVPNVEEGVKQLEKAVEYQVNHDQTNKLNITETSPYKSDPRFPPNI